LIVCLYKAAANFRYYFFLRAAPSVGAQILLTSLRKSRALSG